MKISHLMIAGFAAISLHGCGSDDVGGGAPPASFVLTVVSAGSGSVVGAGINCGGAAADCTETYASGTAVLLTAMPQTGFSFLGWGGDCAARSTMTTCTVTTNAPRNVTASFGTTQGLGGVVGLTSTGKLISFNRLTPDLRMSGPTAIGLASGESVVGIDYRANGNKLYGLVQKPATTGAAPTPAEAAVYELNPLTGAASNRKLLCTNAADPATCATSKVILTGAEYAVDFNPVADRLRVVGDDGQNLVVNVDTGAVTVGPSVSAGPVSAAAYTNNFPGPAGTAPGTVLYVINTATDTLHIQNTDTGALSLVGNLGVNASSVNGFEITGSGANASEAIAALTFNGVARLVMIDLSSGAATTIGTLVTGEAAGTEVRGVTAPAVGAFVGPGDIFALLGTSQLVSFNRATPGTIRNRLLVTGLAPGDQAVAIDIRPKDRKLYALGKLANIYTIDINSGAATLVTGLSRDPADTTDPVFNGLNAGANFGMDFNPEADSDKTAPFAPSLRIVESSGQNLRVSVEGADIGKVIRDLDTNRDNPAAEIDPTAEPQVTQPVTASAYTNGFGGAANTTLFALDSATDRLVTQTLTASGALEEGELTNVGAPFGFDAEGVNGFDVDALTGEAFAAMRVAGVIKLFQLNLTTGVATERGLLGDGSIDVRGLALKVPAPAIVFGLTDKTDALNNIVTFDPLLPGTLLSGPTPIRNLAGGDELIGIAFRPADQALIAVAKSGNIYNVATTATSPPGGGAVSHAATLVTSLAPSLNDNTAPFNQLVGTEFGYDFDPTVPNNATGLRTVGDTGASYVRTNSLTGETFTDSALTRPSPSPATPPCSGASGALTIGAATYSGNGTLFVIDANPNAPCLYTAPAGGGPITQIGFLLTAPPPVLDAGGIAGFDVAGALNGLVLAALEPSGALQSSLYSISLGSSPTAARASLRGPIGPGGTPRIRSITIQLLPPT